MTFLTMVDHLAAHPQWRERTRRDYRRHAPSGGIACLPKVLAEMFVNETGTTRAVNCGRWKRAPIQMRIFSHLDESVLTPAYHVVWCPYSDTLTRYRRALMGGRVL